MATNAAQANEEIECFQLKVLTPLKEVYSGSVVGVYLSGVSGDMEILPKHEPLLAPLRIGPMVIKELGTLGEFPEVTLAVHGGFLDMNGEGAVVYASSAELASEVDAERATESEHRARERLAKVSQTKGDAAPVELDRAQLALARALLRLKLVEQLKNQNV